MKLTRTYYFQYGKEIEQYLLTLIDNPTAPPAKYPSPSGTYGGFVDISGTAQIYINIPFKVKTIHVKGITWTAGRAGNQGSTEVQAYVTLVSSLVGNRPVGMVFLDSQFASGTIQDIEHEFLVPETIQGYYDFTPFLNDGTLYSGYDVDSTLAPDFYDYYFDSFSITMEFNSEGEL
jgi:hypothetical protein